LRTASVAAALAILRQLRWIDITSSVRPRNQVDRHAVTEMDAELERRAERALSGDAASVDWTDVHAEALRRIEGK